MKWKRRFSTIEKLSSNVWQQQIKNLLDGVDKRRVQQAGPLGKFSLRYLDTMVEIR
ncbi:hypothetical protein AVEN_47446-1, partial [Araneus ventricosus]